ncbi:MAG: D-alanine--D-alanine ligase [Planctomycetes bacterium]|nr:D-alanine--D-alanine ligase [Planctomycetota bacterium]
MANVAVLAGGCSAEHDVSIRSALQVLQHLDRARWRPWPVYLDRDGRWWVPERPLAPGAQPGKDFRVAHARALRPGAALEDLLGRAQVDMVFPVLHGAGGEDGTVQGMLELHRVPFVGSGCAASAVAMDKIRTRECLSFHGIPMARCHLPRAPLAHLDARAEAERIGHTVGYPCFLKVDLSGSSIGVEQARGPEEAEAILEGLRSRGGRVIAEAMLRGEEITVPVLGNWGAKLTALLPVGIYPRNEAFFTNQAKYDPSKCEEVVPPRNLGPAQIQEAQELALRCHEALCCDGMSRTDMIVTAAGPVVLEVNTIPGLTEASLLPKAAYAHGWSFTQLLDVLLGFAMERHGLPLPALS